MLNETKVITTGSYLTDLNTKFIYNNNRYIAERLLKFQMNVNRETPAITQAIGIVGILAVLLGEARGVNQRSAGFKLPYT